MKLIDIHKNGTVIKYAPGTFTPFESLTFKSLGIVSFITLDNLPF